jgi:hypothetical protein
MATPRLDAWKAQVAKNAAAAAARREANATAAAERRANRPDYLSGVPGTGMEVAGGLISLLPGIAGKIGTAITGLGLNKKQNYADEVARNQANAVNRVQFGSEPQSDIAEAERVAGENLASELGLDPGQGITEATLQDLEQAQTEHVQGVKTGYGTARAEIGEAGTAYQAGAKGYWDTAGTAFDKSAGEMTEATGGYARDVMQQYQDRYSRNMGYIDRLGQSERDYLDRQYDKMNTLTNQRLMDLGLGGTTVGASMTAGNERRRIQDRNALEENLMSMKFNADVGLSGDVANSIERMGGMTTDLANTISQNRYGLATGRAGDVRGIADWRIGAGSQLDTQQAFAIPELQYGNAANLVGARAGLSQQGMNVITGTQVVPPDMNPFYNAAYGSGYSSVQAAQPQTNWFGIGGTAATGAIVGGALAAPTGGLSIPAGALIGGAAGGAYGSGMYVR